MLFFRWCKIRPASHMPEALMMMAGSRIKFSSFDFSTARM